MMTKPTLDPLPLEYNPHVLHLIEGYARLQARLRHIEADLEESRLSQKRDQQKFSKLCEEWAEREKGLRAEIKRLEVTISQLSSRADSLVRRDEGTCRGVAPTTNKEVENPAQGTQYSTSSAYVS